jgi:drug/metabolite transporter (DMT)-like permease
MSEIVSNVKELYAQKKIRLATFGVVLAFISAITYPLFQTFNNAGAVDIYAKYEGSMPATVITCLTLLAICEFMAGVILIIYTRTQGVPFREYVRLWNVPASRKVLISALVAGPGATASILLAISYCGTTYTNIVMSMAIILTPIGGVIFLKERLPLRVIVGICIVLGGALLAAWSPPENVPNFYLGIAIAVIGPIGFTIEALISAKAMDITEPLQVCGLYRMIGGAFFEIVIAIIVALAAFGSLEVIGVVLSMVFANGWIFLFLLITAVFMDFQYGAGYTCFNYCGAARGNTIINTASVWSIPIGFLLAVMGIFGYNVTAMGIVGAVVVVGGVALVLAKPSDLFNLRKAA